jgi:Tol biopolymer transport system component/DNA-binding winged helix-turn-helix (wHTH) protein
MRSTNSQSDVVRFGAFEADFRTQELRKYGTRLRLPNQSFLVLTMLLERPGELVTREHLRERLWPADTFVEYDQGLNAAVNRLRDVLGDSADRPRFIETLPRRGYRFVAILDSPASSAKVAPEVLSGTNHISASDSIAMAPSEVVVGIGDDRRRRWRNSGVFLAAAAVILILIGVGTYVLRKQAAPGGALALRVIPFTSLPGQEVAPTFSPDGSQIAFAWSGEASDSAGFDLYVKTIGSERRLRLTNHPAKWLSPAWSPDGSQIAFSRWSEEDSGIFVVPALGGPERKLTNAVFWYEPLTQISWSSDNKLLAFWSVDDPGSNVFLLPLDTLKPRPLSSLPHCWDRGAPAFSPNGKNVAFVCTASIAVYAVYLVPLSGGAPRLLASMMGYPQGLTWSADGSRILLANDSGNGGELWELRVDGNLSRLPFGEEGSAPAVASRGDRLAYVRGSRTIDIWRADLAAAKPESSRTKLIFSTRIQRVPMYSPDGTKIVFESNRSGTHEVWLADADGSDLVQLTSFNGPLTGGPAWCSDGRRIAFDSRASGVSAIYVEDVNQRLPVKVQTNIENLAIPSWSPDCRWLYVSDGHDAIYRIPSQGGNATRVTEHASYFVLANGDGVFFNVKQPRMVAIWSKPAQEDTEAPLQGMPKLPYSESWTVTSKGVYYTDSVSTPPGVHFYNFANRTSRQVLTLPQKPTAGGGMSVSPDDRWLLYTQTDDQQSDIMLVEHFR